MNYFVRVNYHLQQKNKLHQAIDPLLRNEIDRTVITTESFSEFKRNLSEKIKELDEKHPRCAATKVAFYLGSLSEKKDVTIDINDRMFIITLYWMK